MVMATLATAAIALFFAWSALGAETEKEETVRIPEADIVLARHELRIVE